jgi:hypothetical protein
LSKNPFYWFVSRSRTSPASVWVLLGATMVIYTWIRLKFVTDFDGLAVTGGIALLFVDMVLVVWASSEAEAHLSRSRRDGSLEMLFTCTPLKESEVIRGQWLGLKRIFLWPVVLTVVGHFAVMGELYHRNASSNPNSAITVLLCLFLLFLASMPWMSMWHGFAAPRTGRGTSTAIGILLLPLVLSPFLAGMVGFESRGSFLFSYLFLTLLTCFISVSIAYHQLKTKLRLLASPPTDASFGFWGRLGYFVGACIRTFFPAARR